MSKIISQEIECLKWLNVLYFFIPVLYGKEEWNNRIFLLYTFIKLPLTCLCPQFHEDLQNCKRG